MDISPLTFHPVSFILPKLDIPVQLDAVILVFQFKGI
jgi:hypothetical protein